MKGANVKKPEDLKPGESTMTECKNPQCNSVFKVTYTRYKNGGGKYCSKDCLFHKTPEERFWAKIDKDSEGGCWNFMGTRLDAGYGHFWDGDKLILAHRFSWKIHNRQIPDGMFVCHHCDNPPCVRPDHLFLGTRRDNMLDMYEKGRADNIGLNNPAAILTPDDVRQIRDLYGKNGEDGLTLKELADIYDVSFSTIHRIVKFKGWKHIK